MAKTIVSVSKKHNSIWRMYFYYLNDDSEYKFQSKKINPLLVWFYKLQKSSLHTNICLICDRQFQFYKNRFEDDMVICSECDPDEY